MSYIANRIRNKKGLFPFLGGTVPFCSESPKEQGSDPCIGPTRRAFLRGGSLAVGLGLSGLTALSSLGASPRTGRKSCIQIMLVGGPSQLDTWDPKPNAPLEIRGPFRPIPSNVPGIQICEHFPRMAQMADRYALVRSVFHDAAPIHETGLQLLQTGSLVRDGVDWPHVGAVLNTLHATNQAWAIVPSPIGHTGVTVGHGQVASFLGPECEASLVGLRHVSRGGEPEAVAERYGRNTFGQSCLMARRLVELGVRLVTVNMFETVFSRVTWDCHNMGGELNSTLDDYKDQLCPMFDQAYTALLEDLVARGLLSETLVLAMGEFGRTPRLNNRGGRDHWPGVWSIVAAGGGVQGGQVIGSSNAHAEEPKDKPIHAGRIAATVCHVLGVDPRTRISTGSGGWEPAFGAEPVMELF